MEDDFLAVSEMKRVCKEDGIICVTVPAFMFLWSKHDEINHHIRRYTQKQLYKVFKRPENVLFSSYFNSILFIPISMMRLFSNIFAKFKTKEKKTSDFSALNHKLLDKIFYGIFSMERPILSLRKRLPFGVSIILSYKNNDLSSAPNLPHKIR